jgi:mannitol-1-phosphate 5-dehydrogenase
MTSIGLTGTRTYVGFGFGAIQAGLFLYEAWRSGNFSRLVVAEVLPAVVGAMQRAGGRFSINIARADGVEAVELGPIEVLDPAVDGDRDRLIEAIASAEEIGTAVPSVQFYRSEAPASLHRVLAAGLARKAARGGPRAVVYAAENHAQAVDHLEAAVAAALPPETPPPLLRPWTRFANTVIGKMSGVVTDASGLAPVTPEEGRAFLVESFNRILVSRIDFEGEPPFRRGIEVFVEKDDLLPFEEAKLYGHNATHALAAYVGALGGIAALAELPKLAGVRPFLRAAFIEESGAALIEKHRGVDPLFTWEGYREYADDLLVRMMNPHLRDTVERVGRDPARKLGWDDRLVGTLRLALDRGVTPRRFALGTAAALAALEPGVLDRGAAAAAAALEQIWDREGLGRGPRGLRERQRVLALVGDGSKRLRRWRASGSGDLELQFHRDDY